MFGRYGVNGNLVRAGYVPAACPTLQESFAMPIINHVAALHVHASNEPFGPWTDLDGLTGLDQFLL